MDENTQIQILKNNDIKEIEDVVVRQKQKLDLHLAISYCDVSKKAALFLAEKYIQLNRFDTHVLPELLKITDLPMQLNFTLILAVLDVTMLQTLIEFIIKSGNKLHPKSPQMEFRLQHLRAAVDRLVVDPSNDRHHLDNKSVLVHAIRECPYDFILELERLSLDVLKPNRNSDNALLAALDRVANPTYSALQDKKDTTTLISWYSPSGPAGQGSSGTKPHCDFSEAESMDKLQRAAAYSSDEKDRIEKWLKVPSIAPTSVLPGGLPVWATTMP